MGWTDGRNLRIDYRWSAGNPERTQTLAKELTALQPDVLFSRSTPVTGALLASKCLLKLVGSRRLCVPKNPIRIDWGEGIALGSPRPVSFNFSSRVMLFCLNGHDLRLSIFFARCQLCAARLRALLLRVSGRISALTYSLNRLIRANHAQPLSVERVGGGMKAMGPEGKRGTSRIPSAHPLTKVRGLHSTRGGRARVCPKL